MKKIKILFTVFTFLSSICGCSLTYGQNYKVAYIHDTDSSNALSFRSFLHTNDYPTTLIKISDISATNFDDFALIMIDSRSGSFGNWGTPLEVQIIQNLNKPIFALGAGGSSFYERLGLSINWGNSWTSLDTMCNSTDCIKIFAEDTTLSVFHTPYNITSPIYPIIQLYYNSAFIGLYKPLLSDSVLYVGREPIDPLHYSIVAEGELYWLWGFDNSPGHMTETGKELFINIVYHLIGGTVDVPDEQKLNILSCGLVQNYPNPFNPSTKISWQSPIRSWQTLKIYDVLGNEVATLVDEYKPVGSYEVEWDASEFPSGVYFYQLQAIDPESSSGQAYIETKKMILIK